MGFNRGNKNQNNSELSNTITTQETNNPSFIDTNTSKEVGEIVSSDPSKEVGGVVFSGFNDDSVSNESLSTKFEQAVGSAVKKAADIHSQVSPTQEEDACVNTFVEEETSFDYFPWAVFLTTTGIVLACYGALLLWDKYQSNKK